MKKSKVFCNEKGFSLVELMVAVGIIGTMSAVAVPKFAKFKAKSLQATVKQTFSSIYTLQNLYFTEHDVFANKDDLDFDTNNIGKYEFDVKSHADANGAAGPGVFFKATATTNGKKIASCATQGDKWCMNQDKAMSNGGELETCTGGAWPSDQVACAPDGTPRTVPVTSLGPCDEDDDFSYGSC